MQILITKIQYGVKQHQSKIEEITKLFLKSNKNIGKLYDVYVFRKRRYGTMAVKNLAVPFYLKILLLI